jgi:hypothetical protein
LYLPLKIEEAFRDLKGLLGMKRLMNKTQENPDLRRQKVDKIAILYYKFRRTEKQGGEVLPS